MTTVLAQGGWSGRLEDCFEKRLCTYVGTLETHSTRYAALCLWCVSGRVPVVWCTVVPEVCCRVSHTFFFSARGSLRVTVTLPRSSPSLP